MSITHQPCRLKAQALIGGVCAGLGRYFVVDVTLVRLLWALTILLGGTGVLIYLIAWLVLPDEDGHHTAMPLIIVTVFVVLPHPHAAAAPGTTSTSHRSRAYPLLSLNRLLRLWRNSRLLGAAWWPLGLRLPDCGGTDRDD